MPRQWFLTKLDPKGELSVPELRDLQRPHMLAYRALVLIDHVEPGMTVKKALAIYRKWQSLFRTLYLQGYNPPCLPVRSGGAGAS